MNNLALNKQLCFKLYSLNKSVTKLYAPLLKKLGLTYPQYLVMLVLWEEGKGCFIKDIGNRLDLDTGTLSPLLKRMEANELIIRERSSSDERAVKIALTNTGKLLEQEAACIPEQLFAKTGLTLESMQELQSTLATLLEQTKKHL